MVQEVIQAVANLKFIFSQYIYGNFNKNINIKITKNQSPADDIEGVKADFDRKTPEQGFCHCY